MKTNKQLYVKQNERTLPNGIAGHVIAHIEGKEPDVDGNIILTVLVRDLDGGLAGPYKVDEKDTEVR